MKIEIFNNSISDFIVGFLFVEILGFLSYLITVGLFKLPYWSHFVPILFLIVWVLIKQKVRLSFNHKELYAILLLFLLFSSFLVYEASSQFLTILTNEGVLHVDMVYHAGITNSMMEFGYPIKDLQFEGGMILYHIFTHFMVSQYTFISGLESYQIYTLFFPFISVVIISILIYDIVKNQLNQKYLTVKFLVIGIVTFMGSFFLPGNWGNVQVHGFFVSPSYQFQIIFFLIISAFVIFKKNEDYSVKDYLLLIVLFSFSILTKGSSLPLLLVGFAFLLLNKYMIRKSINYLDIIFLITSTILGLIIYKLFFSFDVSSKNLYTTFYGFNIKFIDSSYFNTILTKKLNLDIHILKYFTFIITLISFRYYIIKYIKQPIVSFTLGMVFIGVVFFLFYTNNPTNFLKAPLMILNLVFAILIVKNFKSISRYNLIMILGLLILSIYPVSSRGFQMKRWMVGEINRYYPLNNDRLALYSFINKITQKEDVVFTSSVYGATNFSADNFYPASLSKRVFFLGGYEYGNPKYYKSFNKRLEIVNDFHFEPFQFEVLKKNHIRFGIVEYKGNKQDLTVKIDSIRQLRNNKLIKVLYFNSAGVIFEIF